MQVRSGAWSGPLSLPLPLLALTGGPIPGGGGWCARYPAAQHGGVQPVSGAGAPRPRPKTHTEEAGSDAKRTRRVLDPNLRTPQGPPGLQNQPP